jgi:enterochelin esterase-like enzyme
MSSEGAVQSNANTADELLIRLVPRLRRSFPIRHSPGRTAGAISLAALRAFKKIFEWPKNKF